MSWDHRHSFAAGGLVGFSLATYHPWLVFFAGVVLGVVLTLAARVGRALVRELRDYLRARSGRAVPLRRDRRPPYDRNPEVF